MTIKSTSAFFAFLLLSCSGPDSSVEIRGVVHDPNGGVLPGVFVSARDTLEKVTTTVITNENGEFLIKDLAKGSYEFSAKQIGFTTGTISHSGQIPREASISFSKR